jgi:hypothetical protein
MEWKDTIAKFLNTVKPTTVSAADQALADGVAREDARKKREKADADAKAKRLTWSPVEANKAMLKRASEE